VLFGLSRVFDRLMMFTVESIRPIPSAALIPVVLLAFGFGYGMEIFLIVPGATFPILIFTRSAVAGTEPRLLDLSRSIGLGFFARIRKIVLPAALPRIFVGFRLSAALALVIAVTAEVAVNPQGLGSAIMVAEQSLHPEIMYAMLVWLGIIGWGVNALLLWAQRRLFGHAGMVEVQP
jgi:ABC-type nitrate/sulfonate/bicarbonate transport system permease component